MERPAKRARLLDDGEDSDVEREIADSASGAASFKINEEYAKRHQHNAERAEKQRLEEKYKDVVDAGTESDSESESEDEGELATQELDNEILAVVRAIKTKDPKLQDKSFQFFKSLREGKPKPDIGTERTKPLHLRDYHRQNLLSGDLTESHDPIPTYNQEQAALKQNLMDQMRNTSADDNGADDDDDTSEEEFLVKKPKSKVDTDFDAERAQLEPDVSTADQDPEGYLSRFLASRAWAAKEDPRFQPFESDGEDDEEMADAYESAYNMRFEDPSKANETLTSHSRTAANEQSVRREEVTGRKKARSEKQQVKEEEKRIRTEEKARLRRLKVSEAQGKWNQLKEAAGLKEQLLSDEQMVKFLEGGFETENWDDEMAKLLGGDYHNQKGDKPKWADDVDIDDIVPNFTEEDERQGQAFTLSDDEAEAANPGGEDVVDDESRQAEKRRRKDAAQGRTEERRRARLEKRKIEDLVDSHVGSTLDESKHAGFRYRETSPTAFGLTAREILMAEDAQLNEFAGLKKLASFRAEDRKAKDKRRLGKKGRLRQWRKDTFGKDTSASEREAANGASNGEIDDNEEFERWWNRGRGAVKKSDAAEEVLFRGRKNRAQHDGDNGRRARVGGRTLETGQKREKKRRRTKDGGGVIEEK